MKEYYQLELPVPEYVQKYIDSGKRYQQLKETIYLLSSGEVILFGRLHLPIENKNKVFSMGLWVNCKSEIFLEMLNQSGDRTCEGNLIGFVPFLGSVTDAVTCFFDTSSPEFYIPDLEVTAEGPLREYQEKSISAKTYQSWMERLSKGDIDLPAQ